MKETLSCNCLRQTSISQFGFAILPLRGSLNDFDSYEKDGGVILIGGIETKHSAATTLQLPFIV